MQENTQDQNQVQGKTEVQFIKQMISKMNEIALLNEDLKEIKDEAKDRGFDAALLAKVAKAESDRKTDEILEKNELFEKLVQKVDNE